MKASIGCLTIGLVFVLSLVSPSPRPMRSR
jgi:hypothetical protein